MMPSEATSEPTAWHRHARLALILAAATVAYNAAEGVVALWFGTSDETLTLLGFGLDSLIEVMSGVGIMHLVLRLRNRGSEERDRFEATALRITGTAFYVLTIGLLVTAAYNAWIEHKPQVSPASIIIALASLGTMWALMWGKLRVGRSMGSPAILADAACTKTCIYMSVILLASGLLYAWFGIRHLDSAGALGLAFFSWKEGGECFQKARDPVSCCGSC